jgi:activator of Hsp90 ATPase-like protein
VSSTQSAVQAVRKILAVACSPERAFEVFTREIGSWWPLGQYSIGGDKITEVVFEEHVGGRIFERHSDGGEGEWGRLLEWEPPRSFTMSWYPGHDSSEATELQVRFAPDGDGTRVELEHRGWEARGAQAAEARTSYNNGWDTVLGYFQGRLP